MNGLEVPYEVNWDRVLPGLIQINQRLEQQETLLSKLAKANPYKPVNDSLATFNRTLSDGTRIFQNVEKSSKSYRTELERLQKAEKELMHQALQAKSALEFDDNQRNLAATRQRIGQLKAGLAELDGQATKTGGVLGKLGALFNTTVGILGGLFAVDTLVDTETKIVEITGEYEKYNAVLTNAFQSEQLAAQGLKMISDFAVESPYQINELTESYVKLVNTGLVPTKEEMIKAGDLAASQGKSFEQFAEAQIDALTGEYERLKEFGIRATSDGDKVTFAFRGIEKQVSKTNQVAIKDAILSFGALTGVTGTMASQMSTLNGTISNAEDSWEQFLKNLGEKQGGALHTTVGLVADFVGWLREITTTNPETKLRAEQAEFNTLAGAIYLTNENSAERNKLVGDLVAKYPSFLSLIDAEKVSNEGLARAIQFVNQQYDIKIKLAAQDVLAKRNAERVADAYEKQGEALKKTATAYSDFLKAQGKTQKQIDDELTSFNQLSGEEQDARLNRVIAAEQKKVDAMPSVQPGAAPTKQQLETIDRVSVISRLRDSQVELNKAIKEGSDIQANIAKIGKEEAEGRQKLIDKAKDELKVLEAKGKLSKEELARQAELKKFIGGATTYGAPPAPPKPKAPGIDKDVARQADELRRLLKQAEADEARYLQQIQKAELDTANVRLSTLDKFSEEYLAAKRAYDQKVLDEDRKNQVALYAESIKTVTKFKDAAGKTQQELRSLLDTTTAKYRAQGLSLGDARDSAIAEIDKSKFSTDPNTQPVRDLLDAKGKLNERNNAEDTRVQQQQLANERIQTLGEGFDKEVDVINQKYKELYATYKGNEKLIAELRKKEALDVETARLGSAQQGVDQRADNVRSLIDLASKEAGETEVEFARRKQKQLLENERDYYAESLKLLQTYLESEIYIRSVADGKVSKEQDEKNKLQLSLLKAQLIAANKSIADFTSGQSSLADKFGNLWEVGAKAFTKSFGENSAVSKFFNNAQNQEAVTKMFDMAKQAAVDYLNAEIDLSKQRIDNLDKEVSEKESLLTREEDRMRQGLSNDYATVKQDLENKKKARDDEKEHLRKIQKEKAGIEALEIASANAVTVANLIQSMSEVTKGFTTIPIVGVVLAIAAMATLFSAFVGIKAKVRQAQQLRHGGRLGDLFSGRVSGPSHENGGMNVVDTRTGEVKYNIEGKEHVIGSEPSEKHDSLLTHINKDTFKFLPAEKQEDLLKPLGIRFGHANKNMRQTISMYQTNREEQRRQQSNRDADYLRIIAENTGHIPREVHVPIGGGKVSVFDAKGIWLRYEQYNVK